jgi:hypothetical protein
MIGRQSARTRCIVFRLVALNSTQSPGCSVASNGLGSKRLIASQNASIMRAHSSGLSSRCIGADCSGTRLLMNWDTAIDLSFESGSLGRGRGHIRAGFLDKP